MTTSPPDGGDHDLSSTPDDDLHRLEIESVDRWASCSADHIASLIAGAITRRGVCLIAVGGGSASTPVLEELAGRDLRWDCVVLLQTDERLVEPDSHHRYMLAQRQAFDHLPVSWLPLPVDELCDPEAVDGSLPDEVVEDTLSSFIGTLLAVAGDPPVLDVVLLGLSLDGKTASLFPGSEVLTTMRSYVALTEPRAGHRRLTLTRAVFDRARDVVWLVAGSDRAAPLGRLLAGDLSIPAGMIRPRRSLVLADADAARQV